MSLSRGVTEHLSARQNTSALWQVNVGEKLPPLQEGHWEMYTACHCSCTNLSMYHHAPGFTGAIIPWDKRHPELDHLRKFQPPASYSSPSPAEKSNSLVFACAALAETLLCLKWLMLEKHLAGLFAGTSAWGWALCLPSLLCLSWGMVIAAGS